MQRQSRNSSLEFLTREKGSRFSLISSFYSSTGSSRDTHQKSKKTGTTTLFEIRKILKSFYHLLKNLEILQKQVHGTNKTLDVLVQNIKNIGKIRQIKEEDNGVNEKFARGVKRIDIISRESTLLDILSLQQRIKKVISDSKVSAKLNDEGLEITLKAISDELVQCKEKFRRINMEYFEFCTEVLEPQMKI